MTTNDKLREALRDAWSGYVNLSADMESGPLKRQMHGHANRLRVVLDQLEDDALSSTPEPDGAAQPRAEFLALAESCGAKQTGKPDGSESITVVFTIEAWRKFDAALAAQPSAEPVGEVTLNKFDGLCVTWRHGYKPAVGAKLYTEQPAPVSKPEGASEREALRNALVAFCDAMEADGDPAYAYLVHSGRAALTKGDNNG